MDNSRQKYSRAISALIVYTVLIILWGAFVRISGSGDGCGPHWPLCHGSVIPQAETHHTWIEFAHRVMSGLFGLFVFALFILVRRKFADRRIRKGATAVLFFTVTEALLGAGLVLKGYVGQDASVFRAVIIALHLCNTLFLLGAEVYLQRTLQGRSAIPTRRFIYLVGSALLLIAVTGSWAALSTTLFPSRSLRAGIAADIDSYSHPIVRLRILHPVLTLFAVSCVFFITRRRFQSKESKEFLVYLLLNTGFGIATLLLLSPVWMKLTHLLLADLSWIYFVRLSFSQQDIQPSVATGDT